MSPFDHHHSVPGIWRRPNIRSFAGLAILCLFIARSVLAVPPAGPEHPHPPAIVQVDPEDARLQRATEEARKTLRVFLNHLRNPAPDMSSFLIRAAFAEGDTIEPLWIADVSYENGYFYGRVNNDPEALKGLKYGQTVRVKETQVTDWMIVRGHRMLGGYTIRAMREFLDAAGRAAFDEALGLEY